MLSLLKRYRELIVVSALLLYPFATFLARGNAVRQPNLLDRGVIGVSSVVQNALVWTVDGVGNTWHHYVWLRGVQAQNEGLLAENAKLRERVQVLTEAELQNKRLEALLGYSDAHVGPRIAARVIGVNPVSSVLSVRIDRGENDGVRRGMAVVTADGVVGQVVRATGGYADVVLLTDPNSRVAVRDERSRTRGIASGAGGGRNLELDFALRTEDLQEGDAVVTSGTDGVFPPGLLVGKAVDVVRKNTGMFQSASVIPAVDTNKLEEVLVLPAPPVPEKPVPEKPVQVGTAKEGGR